MRGHRRCVDVVLLALAAGCGVKPPAAGGGGPAHDAMVTLERTACYGTCPIYSVTVYRDGTVVYDGKQFVKIKGRATAQLGPDDIARLDQLFTDSPYLVLDDAYTDYDLTDMENVKTSYHGGGKTKSIDHYHGDEDAPTVLEAIERGVDTIVHVEQWIGTKAERDANNDYWVK